MLNRLFFGIMPRIQKYKNIKKMKSRHSFWLSGLVPVVILSLLCGMFFSGHIRNVFAASDLEFFLDPATVSVSSDSEFDVEVKIDNPSGTPVKTVGFVIDFNSDHLEVIDAEPTESGTQIEADGDFTVIADNDVSDGSILLTAGRDTALSDGTIDVATITFRVKNGANFSSTSIDFDESASNTTIRGTDGNGTTELLSDTSGATIVLGGVEVSLDSSSTSLRPGDSVTIDVVIDNPSGKEVLTAEVLANYDSNVFEAVSSSVDFSQTDFEFTVDDEVSPDIHATVGSPISSPVSNDSILIGSVVLRVKNSAPTGPTTIDIDDGESSVLGTENVTSNIASQFNDLQLNIVDTACAVSRVAIIKSDLSVTFPNLIPVTVEDACGSPVPDGTLVSLRITSPGALDKSYGTQPTSNGIANFTAPGSDFKTGRTYTLFAQEMVSGVSDTVVITIPGVVSPPTSGNGGGTPRSTSNTGPAENMLLVLFGISAGILFFVKHKRSYKSKPLHLKMYKA